MIKGIKNPDKTPEKLADNLVNFREFGEFEFNIPLKVEEFKINQKEPKKGYPKFIDGMCVIQYELATKGESASAEASGGLWVQF